MREIILIIKKTVLCALVFTAFFFTNGCNNQTALKGEVEAPVISQYTEVSGKIIEMPLELGQSIMTGDLIAIIDDTDARYDLEQAEALLSKKKALLSLLEEGADSLNIKQAKNNIAIAQDVYDTKKILHDRALSDYENTQSLYNAGAATENDLNRAADQKELAGENLSLALAQLESAKQSLDLLLKGSDDQEIIAAQADVTEMESKVSQLKNNLGKYRITANTDGVIISKNYLLGDIVASGYDIVDISAQKEKYLVTYVPEDKIHNIEYGQKLAVRYADNVCEATVSFIDKKALYTPKDMQTSVNKNKDSFKIKLRLPEDSKLKPGQKAQVIL